MFDLQKKSRRSRGRMYGQNGIYAHKDETYYDFGSCNKRHHQMLQLYLISTSFSCAR